MIYSPHKECLSGLHRRPLKNAYRLSRTMENRLRNHPSADWTKKPRVWEKLCPPQVNNSSDPRIPVEEV